MGHSRKRLGRDGRARYTAYFRDLSGRDRSAGSFSNRKDADRAWQAAEAALTVGRPGDRRAGRTTFRAYVEETWLPNHVLEPSTREGYAYSVARHIMPTFGPMQMSQIMPTHVRKWVTELSKDGVSPATIRYNKTILSAIFTTALNDFITALHPCQGVRSPTVAVKEFRIVTPAEFEQLYEALPSHTARLLVDIAIGSGLRWGELIELRPLDIHIPSGIVTVARSVTEVNPKFHPAGERFLIKPYPKSRRSRRLKLDRPLVERIEKYIEEYSLLPGGLLFDLTYFSILPSVHRLVAVEQLGLTEPNRAGRQYAHGTLSAYTAGVCRCKHCRSAFATYRAQRRATGQDSPRTPRSRDSDGHVSRNWFRNQIWRPACLEAGIDPPVRLHDLRHAHASWLLAGGADLQVVKERLGHGSITTTEKYLHTLPTADETALAALRHVRGQT